MNSSRINDPLEVEPNDIDTILAAGHKPTIQFSRPGVRRKLLSCVNQLCRKFGDALEVRFYGHYQSAFDASIVENLPDVKWLSVDCLTQIENEEAIASLPALTRLSFGVFRFDRPKFLDSLKLGTLKELRLGENAKRNFDLSSLSAAKDLETLFIHGHTRNIEVLRSLSKLTDLSLSAISKHQKLQFLGEIASLRTLTLILGGRTSLGEFEHPALEALNILRVRGFEALGALSKFPHLRKLRVEDQLQLRSIDVLGASLQKLVLVNCKNLQKIEGLDALSGIAELRIYRTNLDLQPLLERSWPPSLKTIALYSGNAKWDRAAQSRLAERGYREWSNRP